MKNLQFTQGNVTYTFSFHKDMECISIKSASPEMESTQFDLIEKKNVYKIETFINEVLKIMASNSRLNK